MQSLEPSFADQIESCFEAACGVPGADDFITAALVITLYGYNHLKGLEVR